MQEEAILKRLAMQAELILDVERLLPQFMLKRLIKQFEQINPKRKKWWHVMKDVASFIFFSINYIQYRSFF